MSALHSGEAEFGHPRLVVPAYFHPVLHPQEWALLAERAAHVRLVILNIANGPGESPDIAHSAVVERLHAAGVEVAGYVDTNYGHRDVFEPISDIGRFLDWYQVTGVCFDRAAVTAESLEYYAALARRARAMGVRLVMFNHGAHPQEAYAEHADLLGTFEGPWRSYMDMSVPRWTRSLPSDKFYHVVHSVPMQRFNDAYLMAARRRAGFAYVTEQSGSNPYDRLPADWPVKPT
jgi:hypothetical protein